MGVPSPTACAPLVSREVAGRLLPWLHTQDPTSHCRTVFNSLTSTLHFSQEDHNILTPSGSWRHRVSPEMSGAPTLPHTSKASHPI